MFSSNQILQISGTFEQLKECLEFALKMYGLHTQFGFSIDIAVESIKKFLQEQPRQESLYDYDDGGTDDGFLMKVIPETFSDIHEGIKQPFYGIVSFESYTNYYSK